MFVQTYSDGTMPHSFPTWVEEPYNSYNPMMYDCWDSQYGGGGAPIHREEQKYIPQQDILEFEHPQLTPVGKASSLNDLLMRKQDPKPMTKWSPSEVIERLCQEARNNNIDYEYIRLDNFQGVTGEMLSKMSVHDYIDKDQRYGSILHEAMLRYNNGVGFNDNLPPFGDIRQQDDVIYTDLSESMCRKNELSVIADNDSYISDASSHEPVDIKPLDIVPKAPVSAGGRRPVGRPPKQPRQKRGNKEKKTGRLWEFIRDLLLKPEYCPSLICWENHEEGVFRFVRSDKVAELWGTIKDNPKMTYEKLSRAMRYYYKSQVLQPVLGRRLVYKFGPTARGWRTNNPNFRNSTK